MPHYTIVSLNPSRDEYWQIHKLNCKDAMKCKTQGMSVWNVEAESPMVAAKRELDADNGNLRDEMGYTETDFREMPCCKEAK